VPLPTGLQEDGDLSAVVSGDLTSTHDAVMEVVRDGRAMTEVAERWGVSRQSVYAWMDRYAAGGLEGLADRSHPPR
jgi:transposase